MFFERSKDLPPPQKKFVGVFSGIYTAVYFRHDDQPTMIAHPRLIQPPYKILCLYDWVKISNQEAILIVSKAVLCLFKPRTKPYSETELTAATLEKSMFFLVASIIHPSPFSNAIGFMFQDSAFISMVTNATPPHNKC